VLDQAERGCARLLRMLAGGACEAVTERLPVDVVEQLVGDRFTDVTGVHADRVRLQRRLPPEELFGGARRLDAVGIGLGLLVQNYPGRRMLRLADAGCRFRLLFLNPASGAMRRRERELALKRGELARTVETSILHVRRVRSRARDAKAFEIHVFDEVPRFSGYFVDADGPDGVAVVQSYLRHSRGVESPALVLRRAGREVVRSDAGQDREGEVGLFDVYREDFEALWDGSRPVS
jgi:hypothetical protein